MRRMGSCPCKQPGHPIARFHSNPLGKCVAGRSAALQRLPIARAIGCAPRLAAHPLAGRPATHLCNSKKTLNRFLHQRAWQGCQAAQGLAALVRAAAWLQAISLSNQ